MLENINEFSVFQAEETPTVFPRNTGNDASNRTKDRHQNQSQSTSTISRPEDDTSREKTFNIQTR